MSAQPPPPTGGLAALLAASGGVPEGAQEAQVPAGAIGSPQTQLLDHLLAANGQLGSGVPNADPNGPPSGWGELPGQDYAFISDPEARQRAELHTTPAMVRMALLRTMETAAQSIRMPFAEQGDQAKASDLILRCAQAYLLIDPEVDATTGVPIVAQALASAAGQMSVAEHKGEVEGAEPAPAVEGVPRPKGTVGNHVPPPRVKTGAMERLTAMHENLSKMLSSSRGDTPTPRPRP